MTTLLDKKYTDIPELTQKYIKQLKWLETRLRLERPGPKEGLPSSEWIAMFAKATKLMTDIQREDRQTKKANSAEELSDVELIKELTPILLEAGWIAPKGAK